MTEDSAMSRRQARGVRHARELQDHLSWLESFSGTALGVLAAEPLYVLVDTAVVGHLGAVPLAGLALGGTVSAAWGRQTKLPAPPLAITGMETWSEIVRISSRSYPVRWPSASMLVNSSSPAPSSAALLAHFSASMPVAFRPRECVSAAQSVGPSSACVYPRRSGPLRRQLPCSRLPLPR